MHDYIKLTPEELTKFWKKVWKRGPDECWPWLGYSSSHTGLFCVGTGASRRTYQAHRITATLAGKDIKDSKHYKRTCTDVSCCNPAHVIAPQVVEEVIAPTGPRRYNDSQRNSFSLSVDVSDILGVLLPLLSGRSVTLHMDDPRIKSIKNYQGTKAKKLVVLIPGSLLGMDPSKVLVSVVNSGCCVIWPARKSRVSDLVLAGVPGKLAHFLMNSLHRLFQE